MIPTRIAIKLHITIIHYITGTKMKIIQMGINGGNYNILLIFMIVERLTSLA